MSSDELCWFHGQLTRIEAEELIKSIIEADEGENGLFLVRESSTAAGDFVLTLLNNDEVCHYQIRRHGEDALFSIADKEKILHGLDTLVKYYQEEANGLECKLTKFIRKDPPPNDSRSHGHTNLLHRATKENNQTVVSELLKCGYRNVDAKNQDGQTAIHLAALHCDESILKLLLEAGVNVNCMDSMGNMPLHYACRSKSAAFIRILINAHANVQGRNIKNGYVPLHEAAKHGNLEAVKELLCAHAPLLPRTSSGEFPIDLAQETSQENVVAYLNSYKQPPATTYSSQWYHGTLNRMEAVKALTAFVANQNQENVQANHDNCGQVSAVDTETTSPMTEDDNTAAAVAVAGTASATTTAANSSTKQDMSGCFLVRYSEGKGYVLTLLCNDTVKNYMIAKSSKYLYIDDGPFLPSLDHLIEHFMRFSDGLHVALKYPVLPKPKPPLPLFSTMPKAASKKSKEKLLTSTLIQKQMPEPKVERQRQNSLDDQKLHVVQKPSNFLNSLKKKPKETSKVSVFNSLRKNKNKLKLSTSMIDSNIPSNDEELKQTETLFKNLTFSTEFSNLQQTSTEKEIQVPVPTNVNVVDSAIIADGFYKVPTNNAAVINKDSTPPLADMPSPATGIESKSDADILYLTQSDVQIERERHRMADNNDNSIVGSPTKFDTTTNANGYIPTVDIRIFQGLECESMEALLREFSQQPERLDSLISNVSNESDISRYLNSQDPTATATRVASTSASLSQRKLNYIIPSENLVLKSIIGEGEFGSVYSSNLIKNSADGSEIISAVAVKMLQNERCRKDKQEFLREASIMIRLHHHCIVQLIGISKGESLMMVQELMPLGSMLQYIQTNRDNINPNTELKLWASQIACGMQYLESQHFVHRDLAARNILLASLKQAKISDFGLSRVLGVNSDFYHSSVGGRWPIKWYAPESANNGIFSHASDVWSFGITLWEMFTLGEPPYGNLPCVNVLQLIESGYRLPQPNLCTNHTYEIMKNCWNYKAKDRPSFRYLTNFFANDPDYENIIELNKAEHIS